MDAPKEDSMFLKMLQNIIGLNPDNEDDNAFLEMLQNFIGLNPDDKDDDKDENENKQERMIDEWIFQK